MIHTTHLGHLHIYRKDEIRARAALWLSSTSAVPGIALIAIPKLYLFGELALMGRSVSLAQAFTEEDFLSMDTSTSHHPFRLIHGGKSARAFSETSMIGVCLVLPTQPHYSELRDIRPRELSTLLREGAELVRIANGI